MDIKKSSGFTLISLMIAILIIAAMAIYVVPKYTGTKQIIDNRINNPIQRTENVDCINNLSQIRNSLELYNASHDTYPVDLDVLSDTLSSSNFRCPTSGNAYNYSPATGKVKCTTPGHEGY